MKIQIKGRNVTVTDALQDYANEKIEHVHKLLQQRKIDDVTRVELELIVEKNPSIAESCIAEATVFTRGPVIRARESSHRHVRRHRPGDRQARAPRQEVPRQDPRTRPCATRPRQDRRAARGPTPTRRAALARRRGARRRRTAGELGATAATTTTAASSRPSSSRSSPCRSTRRRCRWSSSGHNFFVFTNAESNRTNVVYRRNDGHYGLIEPAETRPGAAQRRTRRAGRRGAPSARRGTRAAAASRARADAGTIWSVGPSRLTTRRLRATPVVKIVDKLLHAGEGRRLKTLEEQTGRDHRARARDRRAHRRAAARQDRRVPPAPRRTARRSTTCSTRRSPSPARPPSASLGMRPFDVQVLGGIVLHDGDIAEMKTGEGKTLVADHADVPQRARRPGAPTWSPSTTTWPARRRVDGPGLPLPGPRGRRHPGQHDARGAPRAVQRRRHLRHQQRVRLRLPARQHDHAPRAHGPARPRLLHRGRGRLHPHRRGAHAAHHQRRARDGRRHLPPVRARRARACSPGEDYEVDEKQRTVAVTEEGVAKVEKALDIDNLYKDANGGLVNHLIQALRAEALYPRTSSTSSRTARC